MKAFLPKVYNLNDAEFSLFCPISTFSWEKKDQGQLMLKGIPRSTVYL